MKFILTLILFILAGFIVAQNKTLLPDSLIKKYHVKTMTEYFHADSTKNELSNICKFNIEGKLVSCQIFDDEDSTLDLDLYFYKNNLLTEHWEIGTWTRYDTIKTSYSCDRKNQIIKESIKGKANRIDYTITYKYLDKGIVLKTYDGKGNSYRCSGRDSLIYNTDKTLKCLFNANQDLKISYQYNNQKQLISEISGSISNDSLTFHYNKYYYDKGILIKELEGHSINGEKEKNYEQEYIYLNYENGLVKEIRRRNNFDTYKYEYYK